MVDVHRLAHVGDGEDAGGAAICCEDGYPDEAKGACGKQAGRTMISGPEITQ